VDLKEAERSQLQSGTRTGKHKARIIIRANILLRANERDLEREIASILKVWSRQINFSKH
jgi:hypothetical protein